MVLRRQYRHLREELAKLKVPEGLNDLDAPFNPNVTLPAMTESSGNNGSGTISVTKSNCDATVVHTTVTVNVNSSSSVSVIAPTDSTQTTTGAKNLTESIVSQQSESVQSQLTNAPLTPLEINTNQPFISCTLDDESDSPAGILPQSSSPATVTAKIVKVDNESLTTNAVDGDGNGDEDDVVAEVIENVGDELDVSDYKCTTADELMEQLFSDSSENFMHFDDD